MVIRSGITNRINTVLFFADSNIEVTSPFEAALMEMVQNFQQFIDYSAFATAVSQANPATTLIILVTTDPFTEFAAEVSFINAGGHAIVQHLDLLGLEFSDLSPALDVVPLQYLSQVTPVYEWGSSPFFANVVTTGW